MKYQAPRRELCKRGHVLAETRRARKSDPTSTYCNRCRLDRNAEYRRRARAAARKNPGSRGSVQLRLPFTPFDEAYNRFHGVLMRRAGGLESLSPNHQRAYYRARTAGCVPVETADELACALGRHVSEIWDGWEATA